MFLTLRNFFKARRGLKKFNAVPRAQRKVVFYSEGSEYWTYFKDIYDELKEVIDVPILYVTSSPHDSVLRSALSNIQPFYVGYGLVRTIFFQFLDADILVMTMPDLETFHIKRSYHSVKYIYLHHSMVSTHMIYRSTAFDSFDTIFCVGPHHREETRAREMKYNLPAKDLIDHGYGRLDMILGEYMAKSDEVDRRCQQPTVLLAPTWGENSLLEQHGKDLVWKLLQKQLTVIVRPHPRTRLLKPDLLKQLIECFSTYPNFRMDNSDSSIATLLEADVMITDWSGVALEFAFGTEKPIIYIDIPRKIRNPEYEKICIEPLEVLIRSKIGIVVSLNDLENIGKITLDLMGSKHMYKNEIIKQRQKFVYNLGRSGHAAATYITGLLLNNEG